MKNIYTQSLPIVVISPSLQPTRHRNAKEKTKVYMSKAHSKTSGESENVGRPSDTLLHEEEGRRSGVTELNRGKNLARECVEGTRMEKEIKEKEIKFLSVILPIEVPC